MIIPVYNGADTITATLDSVFLQEVPLEVILIDDGSTDHLQEVLEQYQSLPNFHYSRNEQNLGASGSRNKGVALAKGTYIAFVDADDYWDRNKLKKQLKALEETGCVLCSTGRELMTPEGKLTGRIIGVKEEITYRELLKHNSINCSSVLLRTEAAREFPMEHEDSHEDYITWLKILKKYGAARGINEPLLKYRLSSTGKSGSKLQSARMTFQVYRYMGFDLPHSILYFISYALHGVSKYLRA